MKNTNKTVFITGASSGIGLETALTFFEQGWNVVATMRNPDKRRTLLHEKGLPDLLHLDVTDGASIQAAVQAALDRHGRIDALVNNAGYALYGPFEATTRAQVRRQFDTNILGLIEVTRAILPVFRRQKSGVLINVASMGGRFGFPLYSVYNSTKWAVEGFTEALQYELKGLNIRVKIIEPGFIRTDFYERSLDPVDTAAYAEEYAGILKRARNYQGEEFLRAAAEPASVARVIYRAATDGSQRVRYIAGRDARQVAFLRRVLPERWFYWVLEKAVLD
jgi:NAD(P)-dependent dehydrogenase (short-subunit alcohol dehydrogenase family)